MIRIAQQHTNNYIFEVFDKKYKEYEHLISFQAMINNYFDIPKEQFEIIIKKYHGKFEKNKIFFHFTNIKDAKKCKEYLESLMVFNKLNI